MNDEQDAMAGFAARVRALGLPAEHVNRTLADAERTLKRLAKREESPSGGYERVEFGQSQGWTIEATARMLAGVQFSSLGRGPCGFELWETEKGAWLAVTIFEGREVGGDSSVAAIDAGEDEIARRAAALEHWRWHDRARRMAAKNLGWSMRIEVE